MVNFNSFCFLFLLLKFGVSANELVSFITQDNILRTSNTSQVILQWLGQEWRDATIVFQVNNTVYQLAHVSGNFCIPEARHVADCYIDRNLFTLILQDVQEDNLDGSYHIVLLHQHGKQYISKAVFIFVHKIPTEPHIEAHISNISDHMKLELRCLANSTSIPEFLREQVPMQYKWMYHGAIFHQGHVAGLLGDVLVMYPLTADHCHGEYVCVVEEQGSAIQVSSSEYSCQFQESTDSTTKELISGYTNEDTASFILTTDYTIDQTAVTMPAYYIVLPVVGGCLIMITLIIIICFTIRHKKKISSSRSHVESRSSGNYEDIGSLYKLPPFWYRFCRRIQAPSLPTRGHGTQRKHTKSHMSHTKGQPETILNAAVQREHMETAMEYDYAKQRGLFRSQRNNKKMNRHQPKKGTPADRTRSINEYSFNPVLASEDSTHNGRDYLHLLESCTSTEGSTTAEDYILPLNERKGNGTGLNEQYLTPLGVTEHGFYQHDPDYLTTDVDLHLSGIPDNVVMRQYSESDQATYGQVTEEVHSGNSVDGMNPIATAESKKCLRGESKSSGRFNLGGNVMVLHSHSQSLGTPRQVHSTKVTGTEQNPESNISTVEASEAEPELDNNISKPLRMDLVVHSV